MSWKILCGDREFGADQVLDFRCKQTVDPLFGTLPTGEMTVDLYTEQPLEPQREEALVILWDDIRIATQHVRSCVRTGKNRYRLLAKPRTEFLQTRFIGNVYEDVTCQRILEELFGDQAHRIDAELMIPMEMRGYIDPGTRGQALEQLAFAGGAMITCGQGGDLAFRRPFTDAPVTLTEDQILMEQQVKWLPHYSRFELVAHDYYKSEHLETIYHRLQLPSGVQTVYLDKPYWFIVAEADPFAEILEEGTNYAVVDQPGLVTLEGRPWLDNSSYHTLPGAESEDPWFSHVLTVRDRTLVGSHNVEALLQQLKVIGSMRKQLKITCRADSLAGLRPGTLVYLPGHRGIVIAETLTPTPTQLTATVTLLCQETT